MGEAHNGQLVARLEERSACSCICIAVARNGTVCEVATMLLTAMMGKGEPLEGRSGFGFEAFRSFIHDVCEAIPGSHIPVRGYPAGSPRNQRNAQ